MKKVIFIIVGIVIIAGLTIGSYLWNKPQRNSSNEDAVAKVTSIELFKSYETDEAKANTQYLNKTVQVTGKILDISKGGDNKTTIMLEGGDMFGVSCVLNQESEEKAKGLKVGDTVTLKGICTGGGDMIDVVLDRCQIL